MSRFSPFPLVQFHHVGAIAPGRVSQEAIASISNTLTLGTVQGPEREWLHAISPSSSTSHPCLGYTKHPLRVTKQENVQTQTAVPSSASSEHPLALLTGFSMERILRPACPSSPFHRCEKRNSFRVPLLKSIIGTSPDCICPSFPISPSQGLLRLITNT